MAAGAAHIRLDVDLNDDYWFERDYCVVMRMMMGVLVSGDDCIDTVVRVVGVADRDDSEASMAEMVYDVSNMVTCLGRGLTRFERVNDFLE